MSEIDDEIRRYVAALNLESAPVGIDEAKKRRVRSRRAPLLVGIATALAVVVVVSGFLVANRDGGRPKVVAVSPTTATTAPLTKPCPAASLVVKSTEGERVHANSLPTGFVLTEGSETDLGSLGLLTYRVPGVGDPPRFQLSRYRTTQSPEHLMGGGFGSEHAVVVQGRPAIYKDGEPGHFSSIAWQAAPGIVLSATGYKMSESELLSFANGVSYEPGRTLAYPSHPILTLARADALKSLPDPGSPGKAVLTSDGEFEAILRQGGHPDQASALADAVSAATPMWVVWNQGPDSRSATVIGLDADSLTQLVRAANIPTRVLAALTDRSGTTCAPPFGVLTRSEMQARTPVVAGVTVSLKLTTLGAFTTTKDGFNLANCLLATCDPDVPVWLQISMATGPRFTDEESGPAGRPRNTGKSWQVIAYDAWTGPVNTSLNSSESGAGIPPADLSQIVDLAPE